MNKLIESVVVIGAGTMGAGIAQWFASRKVSVVLTDNNYQQCESALKNINQSWDKLLQKGKVTSSEVEVIKTKLEIRAMEDLPKNVSLVVEAIIEDQKIKWSLFKKLDTHFSQDTVFASNTSSFPISTLAEAVSSDRQEKFIGLHFFNPAPVMKLVEVIVGEKSSKELTQNYYNWFKNEKKEPALCKDSPGFIVNRVARSFYGEALRIAEEDIEERMQQIDSLLKDVGGFKMGPFELMDLIGVDVNYAVTCSVWESYNKNPRFEPHQLQFKMVQEGRFGRKNKRGFFSYE